MGYKIMNLKAQVTNMPDYRVNKYVVARLVKSKLWFYGSYSTIESAQACCNQLGDMSLVLEYDMEDEDDRR